MTTQLWATFHVVMETNATLRVRAALCKRRLSVRHPLKIGCAISNLINIFEMNKLCRYQFCIVSLRVSNPITALYLG